MREHLNPYYDGPTLDEIASWYGVEPEDVTQDMLCDYEHDRREAEATPDI